VDTVRFVVAPHGRVRRRSHRRRLSLGHFGGHGGLRPRPRLCPVWVTLRCSYSYPITTPTAAIRLRTDVRAIGSNLQWSHFDRCNRDRAFRLQRWLSQIGRARLFLATRHNLAACIQPLCRSHRRIPLGTTELAYPDSVRHQNGCEQSCVLRSRLR